ncbi:MAG: hypothetical protein H0Z37_03370 [Firmicutes bacterium]|nr:hypothetical protein [Bacillota bacterium]
MSWQLFRWAWRLEAPVFVGAPPAGSLNRCRLYIPARAVWGALTAERARLDLGMSNRGLAAYQDVGEELRRHFRFTYLYPAERVGEAWRAWLPTYEPRLGLCWQREDRSADAPVPDRVFRCRLLHTRPATAIDPKSDSAASGSLRETECLETRWRDERGEDAGPVALVGYVFAKESAGTPSPGIDRLTPIRRLFLGGDTRYGLGRVSRKAPDSVNPVDRVFGCRVELDGEEPVVHSKIALAHALAEAQMSGALEVVSGWDFGQQTTLDKKGAPLWRPGSHVRAFNGKGRFRIDPCGIWHLEAPDHSAEAR